MALRFREIKEVATNVYKDLDRTRVFSVAAGLAYYFVLALFPLLIFLATLLGFLPFPNLFNQILELMARFVPPEAMGLVNQILQSVLKTRHAGQLSFGILGTLWAASGGFSAMMEALDISYDVKQARPFWKSKLVALGLTFTIGAFMAVAMVVLMVGPKFGVFLAKFFHVSWLFAKLWPFLRWGIEFVCIVIAMELLYYLGPNIKQEFLRTLPGALLGVTTWIVASIAVSIYISHFGNYNATYGALGAGIALMLWLYISAIAILLGAELNSELMHEKGTELPGQQELAPGEKAELPKAA